MSGRAKKEAGWEIVWQYIGAGLIFRALLSVRDVAASQ